MSGETNISELVKNMSPYLNTGDYVFSSIKDISSIKREDTICEFKEQEGITVIIEKHKADKYHLDYDYIAAWITLKIHSSLDAVGLTAIFSNELAKHNISCNVVAGYYHDHIFVNKKDAKRAINALKELSNLHL